MQLRAGVTLRDVARLVPYLERLGVSHIYLSPIFRARAGSTHGYDAIDPNGVDPTIGGERAFERLGRRARAYGLGILLDIVPNHVAAVPENPCFDDVLAHGPASRFAPWFDIDWGRGGGAHDRLVLPVLGDTLARTLARGELGLERRDGHIRLAHGGSSFAIDPASLPSVLAPMLAGSAREGRRRVAELERLVAALRRLPSRERTDPGAVCARAEAAAAAARTLSRCLERSPDLRRRLDAELRRFGRGREGRRRLASLLARQGYRLADWRRARHTLNYRRFFDINDLVALRQEDARVFAATHEAVLEWVGQGRLDGLRIDHVDGLLDPRRYLTALRGAVLERLPGEEGRDFPILVEKILAHGEHLPDDWPVEGTTGYEFLNALEAALLSPGGAARVEEAWRRFTRERSSFAETALASKRRILETALAPDVRRLARLLSRIVGPPDGAPAEHERALGRAIIEFVAHLAVYRTYAEPGRPLTAVDRQRNGAALSAARSSGLAERSALDALAAVLRSPRGAERLSFVQRLQQLSGPAAAKGVEDTALYVHVPLLSRNEVGGEPGRALEAAVLELHAANADRALRAPRGMLSTTTHDTKRSADVRARLDVLSEIPDQWSVAVRRWHGMNRASRRRIGRRLLPDPGTEYLFYQTLVGVWPLAGAAAPRPPRMGELRSLAARVEAYMLKAVREAKRHTSWIDPAPGFERALREFVRSVLVPPGGSRRSAFLVDLTRFVREIGRSGLWNALARTLVHLTSPGVPDLYQGDELWTFSLVDPDNRRPVDFDQRRRLLAEVERAGGARERRRLLREIVERPEDGRIKLHLIRATLAARRRDPRLFTAGGYQPIEARGRRQRHVIAYARRSGPRAALVAVPRLPRTLVSSPSIPPVGPAVWGDTVLRLPPDFGGRTLRSALTGARLPVPHGSGASAGVPLGTLFADLPIALWLAQ